MLANFKRILTAPLTRRLTSTIRRKPVGSPAAPSWRPTIESLEDRAVPATLVTDKPDYSPGETAFLTATGFQAGEAVQFQILHTDNLSLNVGAAHQPFNVTDGGAGDMDGSVNGQVKTAWFVDSDSVNATFQATATGLTSGDVAQTNFTDSHVPAPTFLYAAANSISPPQVELQWQNQAGPGGQLVMHIEKALTSDLNTWITAAITPAGPNNSYQTFTDGVDSPWLSIGTETNPLMYTYRLYVERITPGQVSDSSSYSTTIPVTPKVTINDVSKNEGNSGTTSYTFTVSLSVPGIVNTTVNYATANGSADGSDYTATSGTLTFIPGQTTQVVTVLVNGDTAYEPTETFFVNLSGAVNGTITDGQGLGTIVNDDAGIPALTNPGNKTVNELVNLSFTLSATDVDGDPITYSIASGLQTGMSLNPTTGLFSWTPAENQDGVYTVSFRATDPTGNFDEEAITITVNEVNVAPVLGGVPSSATIPEQVPYTFSATKFDPDVVAGVPNTLTFSLIGEPVGASIDPTTGVFTWTPTEAQGPGDYTFTVRLSDGTVDTDQSITLHVTEVNQAPVANPDGYTVAEGGALSVTDPALGVLGNDSDADIPANPLTVELVSGPADAASFTLNPDGTFSYTHDGDENTSDSFSYRVFDGTTYSNTVIVTITITPVNDAPVASDSSLTVAEDTPTDGALVAHDVDSPSLTYSLFGLNGGAQHGTVVITDASTGAYTYAPDLNYTGPDSFSFVANDGTDDSNVATVTINVTNTNDPATITGTATGDVVEDTTLTTGDTLTVFDPDAGQSVFQMPSNLTKTYGTFTFDPLTGVWSYTLANSEPVVQQLKGGQIVKDTLTVQSLDGTATQVITVTITGTNDPAVIGGQTTGTVKEHAVLTATGALTVFDADAGESSFSDSSGTTTYGSFTFTGGVWTYNLDNSNPAVQALGEGDTLPDSFTVYSSDGTPQVVSITIQGNPDPAVIGGVTSGTVVEDVIPAASGTLTVNDPDAGESSFLPASGATAHGSFNIDTAGFWVYTLNNADPAVQALPAGAMLPDSFTVYSFDGTPQVISITIFGTNDAATIGGQTTGTVTEHGVLTAGGVLTVTDVDTGESSFQAGSGTIAHGSYTIDTAGNWKYTLNNADPAVQALPQGATLPDSFTVYSFDGTSQVVTVTILGTNDAPTIGGDTTGFVKEDVVLVDTGKLTIADVDAGESSFQVDSGLTAYGFFSIDAAGNWLYNLDVANLTVQALPEGVILSDSFTVYSFDGTPQVITIGIEGTNDPSTVFPTGVTLTEGNTAADISTTGVITLSDVDVPPATFLPQFGTAGLYGSFSIDPLGNWTYAASSAHDEFVGGMTYTDVFGVTTSDGSSGTVTINILGTNDPAALTPAVANLTEGNAAADISTSGVLTISDVDSSATFVPQFGTAGLYGSFSIDPLGNWTYAASSAHDEFVGGMTYTDQFTVLSADSTPTTVTVNILGTNDPPTLAPIGPKSVNEGDLLTFAVSGSDPDGGPLTYSAVNLPAGANIDPTTGTFTWTPAENQDGSYDVTFMVADGTASASETVTITVGEVNTAPTLAPIGNPVVVAGTTVTFTAAATDPDVIAGVPDALTYGLSGAPAGASIDPTTGAFTWATNAATAPGDYSFTVSVTDGDLIAQQQVTITVNAPPPPVRVITQIQAAGAGDHAGPHVMVYNAETGATLHSFYAFPGFGGSATVATGDVNGDDFGDVIVGAGPGAVGGHVKVFDGKTGAELLSFFAFPGYAGGVNVGAADVNHDGKADIIVGAAAGAAGGHVKVFDGATGAEIRSFLTFDGYTGGATVAGGDVNHDGFADIVVGAAAPGYVGGHVKVFDGATGALIRSFFTFDGFTGGVNVGATDLDGDGYAEVIVGAGPVHWGGHVKAFDGATGALVRSFYAFPGFLGGITVAGNNGDIMVGAGPGAGPHVKVYDGPTGALTRSFWAFDPLFSGGVFVG